MLKWWLSAFASEVSALLWLAFNSNDIAAFAGYLPMHALACICVALAALPLFPRTYRKPRRWVTLLVFGVSFFVPLLGIATTLIGVAVGRFFPQLLKPRLFESVSPPEYTVDADEPMQRPRGVEARARVRSPQVPPSARLEALATLGSASPLSATLLRDLLADPVDDVRLLAYGLLDQREKDIAQQLARERKLLELARGIGDDDSTRALSSRIAQLYWEWVHRDLAQGDTARYALEQALLFAQESLRERASDGATWLLIARIRLQRGDWNAAEGALNEALKWHVPRRVVLPYLAQLRFAQHRYADVRSAMYELGGRRGGPHLPMSNTMLAVQQYWAA